MIARVSKVIVQTFIVLDCIDRVSRQNLKVIDLYNEDLDSSSDLNNFKNRCLKEEILFSANVRTTFACPKRRTIEHLQCAGNLVGFKKNAIF